MGKLRAKWNTRLEIATRDAENEQRLAREQEIEERERATREHRGQGFLIQTSNPRPLSALTEGALLGSAKTGFFYWRELEVRFKEIQAREMLCESITAYLTRTTWKSGAIGEEWRLGGHLPLQTEFECLGAIAARKLGYSPGEFAHNDWLGRVWEWMQQTGLDKDKSLAWLPTGEVNDGAAVGTTEGMVSQRIAELSARFCVYLMARGTPEELVSHSPEHSEATNRQSKSLGLSRNTGQTKSQRHRTVVIFGAIQSNLKGQKYCAALDGRKVRLPDGWKEEGCPDSYVLAYKVPQWRKRIQDEKSRHRKQYDKTPRKEREAIIQGKQGTRLTR
jgi:hypothetical protein